MSESTIQPELESLHKKLAGQINQDEKELEIVQKRIDKNKQLLHAVNASLGLLVAEATGYGALRDNLRAVINSLPAPRFTALQVEDAFRTKFPTAPLKKGGIRTTLWQMQHRKEILCVQPGNNRQPAIYERAPAGGGDSLSAAPVRRRIRPDVWKPSDDLISTNGGHPK